MGNQEFESPQAYLAHHGVKGMRWGFRKDDKPGSSSGPASREPKPIDEKAFKEASDKFYSKKTAAELKAEGEKKRQEQVDNPFPSRKDEKRQAKADAVQKQADQFGELAKQYEDQATGRGTGVLNSVRRANDNATAVGFRNTEADLNKRADQIREGKLTDRQKLLIGVGAAVAVGGLAVYGSQKYNDHKFGINAQTKKDLHEENRRKTDEEWQALFGRPHPGQKAPLGYLSATGDGFHTTLNKKTAWDIPEFTIPKNTVFQRLSNAPEDVGSYGKPRGAYTTFLNNDKKMYGSSFEFGTSKYTVNFHAKEDVKVASLSTIMSHLAMIREQQFPGTKSSPESLFSAYHSMAGSGWQHGESVKLMEALKTSGYSAIIDHMDAGFMGDLPIVFFGEAHRGTATPRTKEDHVRDNHGLLKVTGQYK